jgi:hypothetical protein
VPEDLRLVDRWVELTDLAEGRYDVQWWDAYEGEVIGEGELVAEGTTTRVELPAFTQDLAAKLVKKDT